MNTTPTITRTAPASREEWLAGRACGIGSSEVASILGINKYETPLQHWRRRMGIETRKETMPMAIGHAMEDGVAQLWAKETGATIIKSSAGDFMYRNSLYPWMQASPDRLYWIPGRKRNAKGRGILECKTTLAKVDPDNIPDYWYCQITYQLGVSGMEEGHVAWLAGGHEFGHVRVQFDRDLFQHICERLDDYWRVSIIGGEQPAPLTAEDYQTLFPRHTAGKEREASAETLDDIIHLRSIKATIADLSSEKEQLENRVKCAFADAEALTSGGRVIATWRAPKPSVKTDTARLLEDHPEMAEQYATEQQGARRLLLK